MLREMPVTAYGAGCRFGCDEAGRRVHGPSIDACSRLGAGQAGAGHRDRPAGARPRGFMAHLEAGAHQCRWSHRRAAARRRRVQDRHLHADFPRRRLFPRRQRRHTVPRSRAAALLDRGAGRRLPRAAAGDSVELFDLSGQLSVMAEYPRDLVGYGRTLPHPRWPGEARIAVQFVINYEEGGESSILHGDAASEAFLSEIVGAVAWPGQRHMNMESIYEYGSRAGFWRLHRMFTQRRLPVTVFAVATAMARNPEIVASMNEAGWEIASHGLKWIEYKDF